MEIDECKTQRFDSAANQDGIFTEHWTFFLILSGLTFTGKTRKYWAVCLNYTTVLQRLCEIEIFSSKPVNESEQNRIYVWRF